MGGEGVRRVPDRGGRWRIAGLAAGLALTACSSLGSLLGGGPASPLDRVELALEPDRDVYEIYEPIRLALRLRNRAADPVVLRFPTPQRYDFRLVDADGVVLWQWSDNRSFGSAPAEEPLDPEEVVVWTATFEGPLSPGAYVAEGTIVTSEGELRAVADLHVAPGR